MCPFWLILVMLYSSETFSSGFNEVAKQFKKHLCTLYMTTWCLIVLLFNFVQGVQKSPSIKSLQNVCKQHIKSDQNVSKLLLHNDVVRRCSKMALPDNAHRSRSKPLRSKNQNFKMHILMKQWFGKEENILGHYIVALFWHFIRILYWFGDPKLSEIRVFLLFRVVLLSTLLQFFCSKIHKSN